MMASTRTSLGGTLGKGLSEPQHAEVVGQVDGETPAVVVTVTEGAPSPRRTQENSRETLDSLIWNKLRYCYRPSAQCNRIIEADYKTFHLCFNHTNSPAKTRTL